MDFDTLGLLKLGCDWRDTESFKCIDFDLWNLKWRCKECLNAEMPKSDMWRKLTKNSRDTIKDHIGLRKPGRGQAHAAALLKNQNTQVAQEEMQIAQQNARERKQKQLGSRERKCATMARLVVLVGTKRLSLVSFYEIRQTVNLRHYSEKLLRI